MDYILLLNQDFSPLNVTTLYRGFKLVFKGKAEIITHDKIKPIKTGTKNYHRPTVIRLLKYVPLPYRKVTLSRHNVYRRDGYKCVYCGSDRNLTLDHMIPKSKGGENNWKNLVTCCGKCNRIKGDTSVEEFLEKTGYTMSHKPFKPTYAQFIKKMGGNVKDDWLPFL